MACRGCEFCHSDGGPPGLWWWICTHPILAREYPDGHVVGPDLDELPTWCPRTIKEITRIKDENRLVLG